MEGLDRAIRELIAVMGVPGAIVSIRSPTYGDLEIVEGYSRLEDERPMSTKLAFRIGSVTKTFTGTMLLQLYEEGKVVLDNPVNDILLGIPNGENITVREVGAMRSGLYSYTKDVEFAAVLAAHPERIWLSTELLLLGIRNPPSFPPGEGFEYSNTNTIVLAMAIERLSDEPFEVALQRRMLTPLKLCHTKYSAFISPTQTNGYVWENNQWTNVTLNNDSWAWSAGELISTVSDMHRYLKLSIADHVTLSDNATAQQRYWQTSETRGGTTSRYGFQLIKVNNFIGHNGSLPGYNTFILYSLVTNTSVVVAVNTQTAKDGSSPADAIAYLIANRLQ